MKTGFTNAFANKPLTKYYYYHGMLMPCPIQPDPEPRIEYPTYTGVLEWLLVYDRYPVKEGYFYVYYNALGFHPSKILDNCPSAFPDSYIRYYFFDMEYHRPSPDQLRHVGWSDQAHCMIHDVGQYVHADRIRARRNIWAGSPILVYIQDPVPPSRIRIWKSSTGDLPATTPPL